jgi:hypothetical protein
LQEQLDEVERFGRPLSEYEQTLKLINTDLKDRDPLEKQNLLNIAAEIDAVKALQAEYDKGQRSDQDDAGLRPPRRFQGLGRSLLDSVRNSLSDKSFNGILATVITGYDPNATNNPVAKPIVKEITGTNKRLDQVIKLLGGTPGTTGLGGIGLGSILSGINGGSLGGLGGGSVLGGGGATGGSQGGSILDRLRNIFSTDQGGIFAPRDNGLSGHSSRLGKELPAALGDLIAGGLIGGRVGGIISRCKWIVDRRNNWLDHPRNRHCDRIVVGQPLDSSQACLRAIRKRKPIKTRIFPRCKRDLPTRRRSSTRYWTTCVI